MLAALPSIQPRPCGAAGAAVLSAPMAIQAINRVQLPFPPALAREVVHFYADLLGLTPMPHPPEAVLRFAARGQRVDLVATEGGANAAPGLTPLCFEVQGLPQLRKRLLDADFVLEEHQPLPGYLRFFVHDPAGNRLEFVEPDLN